MTQQTERTNGTREIGEGHGQIYSRRVAAGGIHSTQSVRRQRSKNHHAMDHNGSVWISQPRSVLLAFTRTLFYIIQIQEGIIWIVGSGSRIKGISFRRKRPDSAIFQGLQRFFLQSKQIWAILQKSATSIDPPLVGRVLPRKFKLLSVPISQIGVAQTQYFVLHEQFSNLHLLDLRPLGPSDHPKNWYYSMDMEI